MKNEDLLQYIWRFQKYNASNLQTNQGQNLTILKPGQFNTNSGPDFLNARIIIDDIEWAGHIEIHVQSNDWIAHKHHSDPNYENVILHVVWNENTPIYRADHTLIPSLSLQDRIPSLLLEKYLYLKNNLAEIPCQAHFEQCPDLLKTTMLEKALAHRLEKKAHELETIYNNVNYDFEELTYQILMRNFGFKLNADRFLQLAESIPYKTFHHLNNHQIEALLFGQAGFLDSPEDEYALKLSEEYKFLSYKYQLQDKKLSKSNWKFLRTRPQNFPTVRLAQMVEIIKKHPSLFSSIISANYSELLHIELNDYWKNHYDFGKVSSKKNAFGISSMDLILINTIAPLLALYSKKIDDYSYFERAIQVLMNLKPEDNFITRKWGDLAFRASSAFDTQAMIEQYNEWCFNKKCLSCPIGIHILKN